MAPMTHALIPGTFDPPTLGHVDLVQRARRLFDVVTVGVAAHPTKQALFSKDDRLALLHACFEHEPTGAGANLAQIRITDLPGLVVAGCEQLGADVIVRGVRSGSDYDYEAQMAATNRSLLPRVDTLLLVTTPSLAHITSTLVRQIASMHGDLTSLVPPPVAAALRARYEE